MWLGSCNSCGQCCQATLYGHTFRCQNLLVTGSVGQPDATSCAVYHLRSDGMPIVMRSLDGEFAYASQCLATYPRPKDAIPPECSYVFAPDDLVQIKPEWSITYAPTF